MISREPRNQLVAGPAWLARASSFSAKKKQGEVVVTLGLTWWLHQAFSSNFLWKDKIKDENIRDKVVDT